MTDITMPQLSDSMEEGTIVKWLINDGEAVAIGEDLLEIETDKATMSQPSEVAGTLEILVPEGEAAPVGSVIARVGALVADRPDGADAPSSDTTSTAEAVAEAPAAPAVAVTVTTAPQNGTTPTGDRTTPTGDQEVRAATPVARRYANIHGVPLATVAGTGPRGRITKNDVLTAAGAAPVAATSPPPTAPAAASRRDEIAPTAGADRGTIEQPTRLQQVIARRMVEAKTTVPHFQVQTEIVMDEAIALRAKLKGLTAEGQRPPSLNDLVVRACAVALGDHPLANGSWVDGQFLLHSAINIGIAVASDGGLVVPVIHDTDQKSLGQIARETRELAGRVRDGSVSAADLSGGTFTVSNLGMYGMTAITPVINVPEAAILGVGSLRPTLARVDGEIVDRTLMTVTLSCDHRILYGAHAALFLQQIKDLLESPLKVAL